ncbi:MAG: GDSL-type esterase/lipase family protein [Verrucomicrobiota bacterium]|nr:GDSL-type esterase/lipase family protein [Verrucomicrobiota bacterium]
MFKCLRPCFALLFAPCVVAGKHHQKLQIFILAGQSNMVGHAHCMTIPALLEASKPEIKDLAAWVFKKDAMMSSDIIRNLIATQMKRDEISRTLRSMKTKPPADRSLVQASLTELETQYESQMRGIKETFVVSDKVHITSIADGHRRFGALSVGYGANGDKIGPEFGFGLSLARQLDAPILIIKTSWGGKSLHYDFRPPSAGPYRLSDQEKGANNSSDISKNAGLSWMMMHETVHEVLKDLKKHHPAYDADIGYHMAGFVWFQGFNDQFSPAFRDAYRDNMVHFIKDVRKEYRSPKMPFVLGVLGTDMTKENVAKNAISMAQREVGALPAFGGNLLTVESYKVYDLAARKVFDSGWAEHFAEWCVVGSDRPYHYLGSGTFFVRLGDAFANAMMSLLVNQDRSLTINISVKDGETIAFLGDSITAAGSQPGGYCRLLLDALKEQDVQAKSIFAGVGGHKSDQMLARLEKDVLHFQPDWMVLSCGVNDVWHGKRGVDLASYKRNISEIVNRAQAAGVKVMILTSTMITEDQGNALNQQLLPYNAFLRTLAVETHCLLADLNADMQAALKTFPNDAPKGKQLTSDGVHMNRAGNIMMARGVARAFGLNHHLFDQTLKSKQ